VFINGNFGNFRKLPDDLNRMASQSAGVNWTASIHDFGRKEVLQPPESLA